MYALIGKTLGHSHSPSIHRAFGQYDYVLHPLPPEQLADFLRGGEWQGLNVTIPYKQTVIPYLDRLSDAARSIGAVNTIVRQSDGSLTGHNTDYDGFLALAARAGVEFAGRKVVVLGSGGTSHTVQAAVHDRGARNVVVVSRKGEDNYENLERHEDAEVLINTTPVGMLPDVDAQPVRLSAFPHLQGVLDVVYNPLRSRLVLEALRRGIPAQGGLFMLVSQAASACGLFTGTRPDPQTVDSVYRQLLGKVRSLVLVGMPGSGKSHVGRLAAEMLGLPFEDSDAEIARRAGCSIPEIFAREGEAGFRAREEAVLADLTKAGGVVLAVGGGAVLRQVNRDRLRQNGLVVRLTRPIEDLATGGRPLSGGPEKMQRMALEREPFYAEAADVTIENSGSVDEAAQACARAFRER